MLAGYGVLVLLDLMSRWPLLERGIGSDRLARWHATGGRTVLTLVLLHAAAATVGWIEVTGLSPLGAVLDVPQHAGAGSSNGRQTRNNHRQTCNKHKPPPTIWTGVLSTLRASRARWSD